MVLTTNQKLKQYMAVFTVHYDNDYEHGNPFSQLAACSAVILE